MERLLQYIWKYRLYADAELRTVEGLPVGVIDPGLQNVDAGPDFFNAKIRIDGAVWAGNVEIHRRASEWQTHGHDRDPAYDSVILHVVTECDVPARRSDGKAIPHLVIHVPPAMRQQMDWLLARDTALPCAERIREVEPVHVAAWMAALLTERLERKTCGVFDLLAQYADDWNEVFYVMLTRSFGFGVNGDAFEWLARSLPFKHILRQRGNGLRIEALLFGQAGLLAGDGFDDYHRALQQEYDFLQKKYDLHPLDGRLMKSLRTRPFNFPDLRLAQLAAVWANGDMLFSKALECNGVHALHDSLNVSLPEYWDTHCHFKSISPLRKKTIGVNAAHSVVINAVVPVLFAYGEKHNLPAYSARALQLLESIPPERNSPVSTFATAGICARSAFDSQALIQLRREYCEKKKCLYCRIGFRLLLNSRRGDTASAGKCMNK
ncbi:MAG: DUF2851 family protein [Tannerella sp.]|jgi:hypothetical protein|nr:DUF2851 family protein [Tannerella sp.]